MKIFVVSWFYVPITTSEALVTYKLLSSSKFEYYVVSARSNKWSYKKDCKLESDNINQIIIDTDDFDEFINTAVSKYEELSKNIKFDAIMTRSFPPECQYAGFKIKEIDSNIPWIASIADPIANNPYETSQYLLNSRFKIIRNLYYNFPHFFLKNVCPLIRRPNYQLLSKLNKLENNVLRDADIIITPNESQAKYIMYDKDIYDKKSLIVPHSYSAGLYPDIDHNNDRFTFAFIGQSDDLRTVKPIVEAVKIIKGMNIDIYNKLRIRFIGNIPSYIKDMVYVFFLQDVISVEKPVDYFESLSIMKSCDVLIHIDAWFNILENGSIFFAAKIADYLGAGKPILGITHSDCPAGKIINSTGGVTCSNSPYDIAKNIINIMNNPPKLNVEEAKKYDSKNVAKYYDEELERRIKEL